MAMDVGFVWLFQGDGDEPGRRRDLAALPEELDRGADLVGIQGLERMGRQRGRDRRGRGDIDQSRHGVSWGERGRGSWSRPGEGDGAVDQGVIVKSRTGGSKGDRDRRQSSYRYMKKLTTEDTEEKTVLNGGGRI